MSYGVAFITENGAVLDQWEVAASTLPEALIHIANGSAGWPLNTAYVHVFDPAELPAAKG